MNYIVVFLVELQELKVLGEEVYYGEYAMKGARLHVTFPTYWEALGLKLKIEQGLMDPDTRFKLEPTE